MSDAVDVATPAGPKIGLFPGTFDPLTNGHLDVILRGQGLFDTLIVAIGHNPAKSEIFSMAERRAMIQHIIDGRCGSHVQVRSYEGLTVDFAKDIGATAILRGLRNVSDLAHEFQLALTNRALTQIETVFVMSGEEHGFTSSSLIKQIASGGAVDRLGPMLPTVVIDALKRKQRELGRLPWEHVDHWKE
jgi:pantetheine-phosphate adenylyltransferase